MNLPPVVLAAALVITSGCSPILMKRQPRGAVAVEPSCTWHKAWPVVDAVWFAPYFGTAVFYAAKARAERTRTGSEESNDNDAVAFLALAGAVAHILAAGYGVASSNQCTRAFHAWWEQDEKPATESTYPPVNEQGGCTKGKRCGNTCISRTLTCGGSRNTGCVKGCPCGNSCIDCSKTCRK